MVAIISVVLVILWPDRPRGGAPIRPAPSRAEPAADPAPPGALDDLLTRYLTDDGLRVEPGGRDADLLCAIPPGMSPFRVHADLAEAVRLWGGTIASGEENRLPGGGRATDLTVRRQRESRTLRLVRVKEALDPPRIAIVVDDFGYQPEDLIEGFLRLPFPITPAVLPGYARSAFTTRRASETGRPPILHLPMEPRNEEEHDPGAGAIRLGMSAGEIRSVLDGDLLEVGPVVGVSNHMGSAACERSEIVGPILDDLAPRRLFFLDNGTTERSVVPAEAARRGIRCLRGDIYLDGEPVPTRATMTRRLREASGIAATCGRAIVVAHARPATLEFLRSAQDSLAAWGCRTVALGDLLR